MKNKFTEPNVELMNFLCAGESDHLNGAENAGDASSNINVDNNENLFG